MKTEQALAYSNGPYLLEGIDAWAHVAAVDVLAKVLTHDAAAKLTESLTAALEASEAKVGTLAEQAAAREATATATARAVREARAAIALLEPPREALEAGRSEENRREHAQAEEELHKAENARNSAEPEVHLARSRLNQERTAAAAIRTKIEALATVPELDAEALAPFVAALRAPAGKR